MTSYFETQYSLWKTINENLLLFPLNKFLSCHYYSHNVIDCRYKSQNKKKLKHKMTANDYEFPLKRRSIEVWLSTRVNDFKFSASCACLFCRKLLLHTFMCIFRIFSFPSQKKVEQKTHRKLFSHIASHCECAHMNGTAEKSQ